MLSNEKLQQLCESTEVPAEWWNSPSGWMLKPNFKRKEQLPKNRGKARSRTIVASYKKTYQWRWWSLDGSHLRYAKAQDSERASGEIDLCAASSVTVSVVADAPSCAIDINTKDCVYTIAADTREEIVRWTKVLRAVIAGDYTTKQSAAGEFEVIFATKESLFMCLAPRHSNSDDSDSVLNAIEVVGFERRPNGSKGQAEASRKIEEGDTLIGVNGVSFEGKTFTNAIAEIKSAAWPIALSFRRIKESDDGMNHSDLLSDGHSMNGSRLVGRISARLDLRAIKDTFGNNSFNMLSQSAPPAYGRQASSKRHASERCLKSPEAQLCQQGIRRASECCLKSQETTLPQCNTRQSPERPRKRHSMICVTTLDRKLSSAASNYEEFPLTRSRPRSRSEPEAPLITHGKKWAWRYQRASQRGP
jgi:hypothetical protein